MRGRRAQRGEVDPEAQAVRFDAGVGVVDPFLDRLKLAVGAKTDNVEMKQRLAAAYNNLASIHQMTRPAEAAALYRKAIELVQTAIQAEPANLAALFSSEALSGRELFGLRSAGSFNVLVWLPLP